MERREQRPAGALRRAGGPRARRLRGCDRADRDRTAGRRTRARPDPAALRAALRALDAARQLATSERSRRRAAPCGRRFSRRRTRRRRGQRGVATSRRRAAGSSSASSGRRHGSRAQQTTRRSRSTASPADPSRRVRQLRPSVATSWTRTTRDCGRHWPNCARRTSSDTTRRARSSARSPSATGRSCRASIAPQHGARATNASRARSSRSRPLRPAGASRAPRSRRIERALAGFRAAPLSDAELARRAGQLERFLQLVPIEYGRGVQDGRVTLEFEIQEAVTFRDGAAAAFHDVEPTLMAANAAATRRLGSALDTLGTALAERVSRRRGRGRRRRAGDDRRGTRAHRPALPELVEGGVGDRRLRRHRRDARPAAGSRGDRGLEASGDGAARGVRRLRARAGATSPRAGTLALPGGRGLLLVRSRRP